jgi:ribonuclease P protein component
VGHATERNRIKRRLRAAAHDAGGSHADKRVDVVVIGRRDALSAPYGLLVDDIDRGLGVVTKPKGVGPKGAGPKGTGSKGAGSKGIGSKGTPRRPSPPLATGDSGREPPHA